MADLRVGSTTGGSVIWHQGNFPLTPVSNDLFYKTYKVYTEFNKPQAADNDFVSKALGGNYKANVYFEQGLTFNDTNGYGIKLGARTGGAPFTASFRIKGPFGFETETGTPFIIFDPDTTTGAKRFTVMGDTLARQVYDDSGRVFSPGNTPSKAQVGLSDVDNAKQVQINNSNIQSMAGVLSAPNFISRSPGTLNEHVPRIDQVVLRGTSEDFGYY
ncbi:tail connector protein [Escherichia phage P896]|nr:tail connector protein [Escherichia phage P896]